MSMKNLLWAFLLITLFPLYAGANNFKEKRRLMAKRPGHSHSPQPCEICHLARNPELVPKLKRVTYELYNEECGACHLAYQPELLPRASWKKIMGDLSQHFGDDVQVADKKQSALAKYIYNNTADHSRAVRAKAVMKSLKGAAPMRITEVPYIKKRHQEITPEVFARKSIRSFANCEACHLSADGGLYYKPHIHIPAE